MRRASPAARCWRALEGRRIYRNAPSRSPRTCGCQAPRSPSACLARLCLRQSIWYVRFLLGSREEKRRIEDNWPNYVQLLRTAHLQSDVTERAASTWTAAAIFSNTYENDNPTTKLKNEVKISTIHPAVARVGSDGGYWEFSVV